MITNPFTTRAWLVGLLFVWGGQLIAFDFSTVQTRARAVAAAPYQAPTNSIPENLRNASYLEHQAIRFRPERALWRDQRLPFFVEYMHPGYFLREAVILNAIEDGQSRRIRFDTNDFNYGTNYVRLPPDLGYAGFRLIYGEKDFGEVAAFAGASYFRMIGRGQNYGSSARGLALNTTSKEGEEFPIFREFWLERPLARATNLTVYALLDGPSIVGAYQFDIKPGTNTLAAVRVALYPRREVKEFGLAPLTSMFLHGKNGRTMFQDFRPEVHDADGLLMHTGRNEWIWHSLEAGKMIRVNAFADENPRGFGLFQRERHYGSYQDTVAHFQRRPSVWVVPTGGWGKGVVELVQLPSDREFQDNIVAFWVPDQPVKPGNSLELRYLLSWTTNNPVPPNLGYVVATRLGRVMVDPPKQPPNLRFVVDFGGRFMEELPVTEMLSPKIEVSDGVKLVADSLFKNDANRTWRLVIEIEDPRRAVDLRAALRRHDLPITETWTFTWQP